MLILRLAEKYHKLPSEVENEDVEWIRKMLLIGELDNEAYKIRKSRNG